MLIFCDHLDYDLWAEFEFGCETLYLYVGCEGLKSKWPPLMEPVCGQAGVAGQKMIRRVCKQHFVSTSCILSLDCFIEVFT